MNEDSSNLRLYQENMRKAIQQEGLLKEIQFLSGVNSDDDKILMSFADSLNVNSPQSNYLKASHLQIENIQINDQKQSENEIDSKFIDLLGPQNRSQLFESEIRLNAIKYQQMVQKQASQLKRRVTQHTENNQVLSSQKEVSNQSMSYELKTAQQNSKQSIKQSQDTVKKNLNIKRDSSHKNHKSVDQNFEQLKQYQDNILKVSIPKTNFMNTLKISKLFIHKMKMQVRSYLSRNLSLQAFRIIDDKASNYEIYIEQQKLSSINEFFKASHAYNFLKENTYSPRDIFLILMTFYLIIFIPFDHVYQKQDDHFGNVFHDQIIFIIMILEIFVNLNSVSSFIFIFSFILMLIFYSILFQQGNLLQWPSNKRQKYYLFKDAFKKLVIKIYLLIRNILISFYKKFRRDLVVVFLYKISRNYQDTQSNLKYVNYIVFIKYLDIPNKLSELETKLHFSESTQNWLKLLKLEIFVLILAHVAACIFLRIGMSENQQGWNSWIVQFKINELGIWELYLVSFYYMTISMVTIGYGDFYPATMYERGYMIIVALLATNVCAYSFSQIGEIVKFEQAKKENFRQSMVNLNQKMHINGISMTLQQKIRKFFEYHYFSNVEKKNETEQFVEQLPLKLRQQFCLETNQKLINSVYIFKILSPQCIQQIASSIKQKFLIPDEILLENNSNNDCLYYINKGFLDIYTTTQVENNCEKQYQSNILLSKQISKQFKEETQKVNQKILLRLTNQDVFGYESFLLGEYNSYCLKSFGKTIISYIDRASFFQILKQFPDDYEKVMHIRDQASFDTGINQKIKLKCISCSSNEHQYHECPFIIYTKRYKSFSTDMKRSYFQRKKSQKTQTLENLNSIQEKAMQAYAELNDLSLIFDAASIQHLKSSDGEGNIDSHSCNSSKSDESDDSQSKDATQNKQALKNIPKQLLEGFIQHSNSQKNASKSILEGSPQSVNSFIKDESLKNRQQENNLMQENSTKSMKKSNTNKLNFQNERQSVSEDIQFDNKQSKNKNNSERKKKSKTYNQQKIRQAHLNKSQHQKQMEFDKKYSKTMVIQNYHTDQSQSNEEQSITQKESIKRNKNNANSNSKDNQKQQVNQIKQKNESFLEKVYERRKRKVTKIIQLQNQLKLNRIAQVKQLQNSQLVQDEVKLNKDCDQILNICKQKQFIHQILMQNGKKQQNLSAEKSQSPHFPSFEQLDRLISKQKTFLVSPMLSQSQKSPLIEQEMIKSIAPHEVMIRCQENVQDLDMLIVRKQYMLLQQQNKNNVENYIEVPDNEIDIDLIKEYHFYHPFYNCKAVLNRIKKIQEKIIKISKQKDRVSITKKVAQTKKKFDKMSNTSLNVNGKQTSNKLKLLLLQNAQPHQQ